MTQKYQVKVSMKQAAVVETGIVLKQGDFGMQIEIEVLDFDATGTTPQIVFRKAMGAVESTTISVSNNKYTYTFVGTELDTPGKCFCDLKLKNSTTQRISTASFMFRVVADTLDGLAEEASSYSDTIAQIVAGFDDDISALDTKIDTEIGIVDSKIDGYTSWDSNGYIGDLSYIQGEYYKQADGSIVQNAGFSRTDYIRCKNLNKLIVYVNDQEVSPAGLNWFFDKDKNPVTGGQFTIYAGANEITVPANAVYFGISAVTSWFTRKYIYIQQYALNFANDYDKISEAIYTAIDEAQEAVDSVREIAEVKAPGINLETSDALVVVNAGIDTSVKATIGSSGKIFKSSKNLLGPIAYVRDFTAYGVGKMTEAADGDVTIDGGTATANLFFYYNSTTTTYDSTYIYLPAGTYTWSIIDVATSGKPAFVTTLGIRYCLASNTSNMLIEEHRIDREQDNNYWTFTFENPVYIKPYAYFNSGTVIPANSKLRFQIEKGSTKTESVKPAFVQASNVTEKSFSVTTKPVAIWSDKASVTVQYITDTKTYVDDQGGSEAIQELTEQVAADEIRINNHETRLDSDEAAITQNSTDISSLQTNAVLKQQAVADAGKYLHIGSDGKVTPESIGVPTAEQVAAAVEDWMDEHPGITMQYDTLTGEIGVINPEYIWGDVRRYGIFPDGTTNWDGTTSYVGNCVTNSSTLGIEIFWPAGYYASQLNIMKSNVQMRFAEGAEFGGLVHVVSDRSQHPQSEDQNPLRNIRLKGTVTTYGRYGQTDAQNVWVDRIHLKADSTKDIDNHIAGRGAHFYWGNDGFLCDEIISDGCDNALATLDASIAIDGFGNNPKNFHIGRIHIKDSKIHGLYLTGTGHWIGEVVVDAFGSDKLNDNNSGLQDTNGQAQSRELCGVWLNRVQDCYIGKISVNQDTTDERPNAAYSVRIDETGIASFGAIKIDQINALNVRESNRGVTFGDINYAAPRCYSDVGQILISADNAVAVSGYGLLTLAAETAVNVHSLFEKGRGTRSDVLNNSTTSKVDMKVNIT